MAIKTAPAASRCLGLPPSIDSPSRLVHPRARELYEHLRTFPWDVSCLTYLRGRHEIFPEVFAGKSTTTQLVEYLVELRFLATALNGWSEVALGRSPHHLAPLDKRFIILSIANAYHELPDVLKELMTIKDRSYSSSVKKYCDEVHHGLSEIYRHFDIKTLSHWPSLAPAPPAPTSVSIRLLLFTLRRNHTCTINGPFFDTNLFIITFSIVNTPFTLLVPSQPNCARRTQQGTNTLPT